MITMAMVVLSSVFAETDKEVLKVVIENSTKLDMIYTILSNHLEHHFIYTLSAVGFAGTTLLFALKLFLTNRKLKKGDK